MKIYRKSFWNTQTTFLLICFFIFYIIMFLYLQSIDPVFNYFNFFLSTVFLQVALWIAIPLRYFYIILTDDKLIIKSSTLPFVKYEKYYNDIQRVVIVNETGTSLRTIRINVVLNNGKRSTKYCLDMVSRKDYAEIIKKIEEKGINVRADGV